MSETDRTDRVERAGETDTHLQDVEDGCGCAEVWEHLSEERGDRTSAETGGGGRRRDGD